MSSSSPEGSDREVCVFYKRIGSCRHANKCSRIHVPPDTSKTIMIRNLYRYVMPLSTQITSSSPESRAIFEEFYEEVFTEIDDTYGQIDHMIVCENMGEHLIGNVYIKFDSRSSAERAVTFLNNRYFGGFPIFAELSPVENFRDAVCRQHDAGECSRGGFCNFLHIKHISRELEDKLYSHRRSVSPSSGSSSCSDYFSDYSDRFQEYYSSDSEYFSDSMVTESSYCSTGSSLSPYNDTDVEPSSDKDDSDDTPRAFRLKPLKVTDYRSSPSSEDEEVIDRHQQVSRRLRWEIYREKLENEWDDERERQYVFNLLELT